MKLRNIILSVALAAGCLLTATGCKKSGTVGNAGIVTIMDGDKIAEIEIEDYGTIRAKLFPDLAPNAVDNFIKLSEQGYYDGLKIHRVMPDNMIQGGSLNGDGTGGKAIITQTGTFPIEISEQARNFYGALGYANVNGENTTQFYIVNNKTPIDITKYDSQMNKDAAAEIAEKLETMDTESKEYAELTALQAHYTNFATMLDKATDDVKAKYNAVGGVPHWDGGYTVFGQVFEGFDVLDSISQVELCMTNDNELSRPVKDIIIHSITITEYKTPTTEEASDSGKGKNKTSKPDASSDAKAGTSEAPADNAETVTPAQTAESPVSTDETESAEPISTAEHFSTIEDGE